MQNISISDYLELVALKIKEAESKQNYDEAERLLRRCCETLTEKANEILRKIHDEEVSRR